MSLKSIKFHVEFDDYFGTVAAVLNLIKQTPENIKQNIKILELVEKDLMILQKKFKIIKK